MQDMSVETYIFLCRLKNKGVCTVLYWLQNMNCINTWGNGSQVFSLDSRMTIMVKEWYFSAQWKMLGEESNLVSLHVEKQVESHPTALFYKYFKTLVSPCFQVRRYDATTEEVQAVVKTVNSGNK